MLKTISCFVMALGAFIMYYSQEETFYRVAWAILPFAWIVLGMVNLFRSM